MYSPTRDNFYLTLIGNWATITSYYIKHPILHCVGGPAANALEDDQAQVQIENRQDSEENSRCSHANDPADER